jgi:hypothetical protein
VRRRDRGIGGAGDRADSRAPVTRFAAVAIAMLSLCPAVRPSGNLQAQETSLSLYSDGRVLVRRTLPGPVARGRSVLSAELGVRQFDPTSLVSLTEGVEIAAVNLVTATGQQGALLRALGREVEFLRRDGDSVRFIRATLLSVDPPAVRYQGRVLYELPGTPAFTDDLVRLAHGVEISVNAAQPRPALQVAYLTEGVRWQAAYSLMLPARPDGRGTFSGNATIENAGGLSFEQARVQLVAGSIRRVRSGMPRPMLSRIMVGAAEQATDEISAEAVGETQVYALPEPVSFAPGLTRTVALVSPFPVEVSAVYQLESQLGIPEFGPEPVTDLRPEITYVVRRRARTPFGDQPLPAGVARVYVADAQGRPQLVGESPVGHTPAGRDLRLTTGTAFDITAERTQTFRERRGQRELVAAFRVVVRNAKDAAVTVEVLERFIGNVEVLSSTVPAERVAAGSVRFPVTVAAGGEAVLEYRARVRW